jgi:hypothetical protein
MATAIGPYDNAISSWGVAAQVAMGFMESISPAIVTAITTNIALHKSAKEQRIIDRRIRRCKRICRRGSFNQAMIANQVAIDFSQDGDTAEMRTEITKVLTFVLLKITLN